MADQFPTRPVLPSPGQSSLGGEFDSASESGDVSSCCSIGAAAISTKLPDPLDDGNVWRTIVSAPWRAADDHINVLELRAVSTAVRWALSSPASIRTRVLLLSDSTVCVFSLLKGRSSSPLLRPRLRGISALLLAAGVTLMPRWVPSALNPADGPSRRF